MSESAIILANGYLRTVFAKSTHGMVRGPCRYRVLAVIDPDSAGADAGELLDGRRRGIPVFASVSDALERLEERPDVCVVGVATVGGVLPEAIETSLREAARAGLSLVNGLHRLLSEDPELVRLTRENGARIVDIRKPRPASELRFWSGEVLELETPRVAVLGTDCALGKRTTASLLVRACRERGITAEMIYTGQTGWLQGYRYGFIFDATLNDFIGGELEGAILDCARQAAPEILFLEGQSSLRNPAGPAGSELVLSGAVHGVILQHAPGRRFFEDLEEVGCEIPPVRDEIEILRLLGSEVWMLALHEEGLTPAGAEEARERLSRELGLPVVRPLHDDPGELVELLRRHLPGLGGGA